MHSRNLTHRRCRGWRRCFARRHRYLDVLVVQHAVTQGAVCSVPGWIEKRAAGNIPLRISIDNFAGIVVGPVPDLPGIRLVAAVNAEPNVMILYGKSDSQSVAP